MKFCWSSHRTSHYDSVGSNLSICFAEKQKSISPTYLVLHGALGHKDMEIITALQSVLEEGGLNSLAVNLSLDVDDRQGFLPCDVQHTHKLGDASAELNAWISWLQENGAGKVVLVTSA